MVTFKTLMASAWVCGAVLGAQNLLRQGDFSTSAPSLEPECRINGGKMSLFTENMTWNRCGKLEIDKIRKTEEGHELASATVWIGGDGKRTGFAVRPTTTYRFSLEIRGSAPGAYISAHEWYSDATWKDDKTIKTTVGSITVQKGWTRYEGTFTTGPRAKRAALQLGLWHSTKYGPQTLKVGDYILFDNVSVKEHRRQGQGPAAVSLKVSAVKSICAPSVSQVPVLDGKLDEAVWGQAESAGDFLPFRSQGPLTAGTSFRVLHHGHDLYIGVDCEEPKGVVAVQAGSGKGLWRGDVVEIFFGPHRGDRILSQFVVGAGGGRFFSMGQDEIVNYGQWEAKTSRTARGWSLEARIPLRLLGWTETCASGESIGFNVCRQRTTASELQAWTRLGEGFHEPEHFGRLILGSYDGALKRLYGYSGGAVKTRSDYEAKDADIRLKRLRANYEKLGKRKFSVAPVSVTSDFTVPFMPDEVFEPVETIALKAAVNELKPLPVAIANLTAVTASYRVILESPDKYIGNFGLKGFPVSQVSAREAIRFKDNDEDPGRLRLDPLPLMNQACIITVPPKEAGLVWFDFDTAGVKPGTYEGRLRVIPLSEPATWEPIRGAYHNRRYTGDMQDIPVTLEVRNLVLPALPLAPIGFYKGAHTEQMFELMVESGAGIFSLSPWSCKFARNAQGDLDLTKGNEELESLRQQIRNHLAWGRKMGITPKFDMVYSAYDSFCSVYGLSRKPQESYRLWPQWIKAVAKLLRDCGVPATDFTMETFDEPDPKRLEEILKLHELAKKAEPDMRLELTLGAHIMKASDMERLAPVTDGWVLWRNGYFHRPEHLAFIRKTLAQGKDVSHYTCTESMRAHLSRNFRHHAWFADYHRLTYNMFFTFSHFYGQYGTSDFKITQHGGLVYRSFDQTLPSIRYMAIRQGFTDVKYLDVLRRNWGDRPDVQAFLKTAAKRVVVDFAHDSTMADKVREEAARLILKLQQAKH